MSKENTMMKNSPKFITLEKINNIEELLKVKRKMKNHFPNYELPIDENNNVDIKKLQKFAVRVSIDPIYRARMQGNLKTKILKAAVGLSTLVVGGAIAKGHTDRRRKENNAEAQQKFDEFMARGTRVKNMK